MRDNALRAKLCVLFEEKVPSKSPPLRKTFVFRRKIDAEPHFLTRR